MSLTYLPLSQFTARVLLFTVKAGTLFSVRDVRVSMPMKQTFRKRVVLLMFGAVGIIALHQSHAAPLAASFEAEGGMLAGAQAVADSTASNGNAVQFGVRPY